MQNGPEILCTVDHVTAQFDIGFCGFLCTKRMLTGTSINKLHICRRTSNFFKVKCTDILCFNFRRSDVSAKE